MPWERMSQNRNSRMPIARAFRNARVDDFRRGARPTGRPRKIVAPAIPPSRTTCASDTDVILGAPNKPRKTGRLRDREGALHAPRLVVLQTADIRVRARRPERERGLVVLAGI